MEFTNLNLAARNKLRCIIGAKVLKRVLLKKPLWQNALIECIPIVIDWIWFCYDDVFGWIFFWYFVSFWMEYMANIPTVSFQLNWHWWKDQYRNVISICYCLVFHRPKSIWWKMSEMVKIVTHIRSSVLQPKFCSRWRQLSKCQRRYQQSTRKTLTRAVNMSINFNSGPISEIYRTHFNEHNFDGSIKI